MEPLRPHFNQKVLEFVKAHTFYPADLARVRSDGVCRLNPEMARQLIRATIKTLDERVTPERLKARGYCGLHSTPLLAGPPLSRVAY